MKIVILGIGCPRCKQLEASVRHVVSRKGVTVTKVTDMKKIMTYGVLGLPALIVDGRVVCSGRIPTESEIMKWTRQA